MELNNSHCEDQTCEREPLRNEVQPNVDGGGDVTTTLTSSTSSTVSSSPTRRRRVRRGGGGGGGEDQGEEVEALVAVERRDRCEFYYMISAFLLFLCRRG